LSPHRRAGKPIACIQPATRGIEKTTMLGLASPISRLFKQSKAVMWTFCVTQCRLCGELRRPRTDRGRHQRGARLSSKVLV
jgi:hypothetical protein